MNKLEPIKKLNAREPKVANGGMPSRNSGTYHKDCHGSIPAKLDVRATAAKVLKGK
jgi:hypothetical protein